MATPPSQRNGSAHLTVGTPHSQSGSRGPSPHMTRRGEGTHIPVSIFSRCSTVRVVTACNLCLPVKPPRSRPQPHQNRSAPSPPSPATPRLLAPLITHPSPLDATSAKTTSSMPQTTHPHSPLKPIRSRSPPHRVPPPLLILLHMMACTPTQSLPTTPGHSLAPQGQLPDHGPDPPWHRPLNPQETTMASAAPPPRS